ncbi:unnamed protein product [Bemisia tabaci]|uniref:Phosphatidylinositol glycan anchor biosynthesis class U protein n=1 Tax=Bemisia tabaci TaxID=7038 RepID=A0A9P0F6V0_BEMTA|nr:unnamed protein product [Bemisia tabaci]
MDRVIILECVLASLLRFWLSHSEYKQIIADRVEVSTPVNSWKRVLEGSVLYDEGIDPYKGDIFHETPFILVVSNWLMHNFSPTLICLIFIACDILTAVLLYKTAALFMNELFLKQEKEKGGYAPGTEDLHVTKDDIKTPPIYVLSAFLFNPYIICPCVAQSTTVFANFLLAATLYFMAARQRILCCLCLSAATVQSIYPISLIAPIYLYFYKPGQAIKTFLILVSYVLLFIAIFLFAFAQLDGGSWNYLNSVYGFVLTVPDLRPNVGLFWYFFTEMFEHFRPLFVCAFQINALFLYVVPLSFRLHEEPMLLATSLTALSAIFKSYPSVGDVGFYLSLLPMWKHLFHYMQQGFFVLCFLIGTSVFGPTVWHLWIYARSANANFYFGVTLAFATSQIFLITDILFAYIKRQFALAHGLERILDGKEAKLILD